MSLDLRPVCLFINDLENTNSKNSEFRIDHDITNKADINKVKTRENPCKIHQESEEYKSREVSYSSEDFSFLLTDISRKNINRIT